MGKIDAILHAYSAIFAAEYHKEQSSNTLQNSSDVHRSHPPPPISHNTVLRDTQQLWLAASPEHRAALEVFSQNKFCVGIFPHCRRRSASVKGQGYYTTTIGEFKKEASSSNIHFNDSGGKLTEENNSRRDLNEKYKDYLSEDPSKCYSLRLPKSFSAENRNQRPQKEIESVVAHSEDELQGSSSDYSDSEEESHLQAKAKRISSKSARKIRRNLLKSPKADKAFKLSKKNILRQYLQQQADAIRALKESKVSSSKKRNISDSKNMNSSTSKPIMEIDWTYMSLPSKRNIETHEENLFQNNTKGEEIKDVEIDDENEVKSQETGSNLSESNSKIEVSDEDTSINLL